ncbi:MAG TPA: hypothetical protein VI389_01125 [Geobacteraceae bacterium]
MTVDEFCADLDARLAPLNAPGERQAVAAGALGEYFGVGDEEVAFFSFDRERSSLVFVWPRSLRTVGSIPLSAHNCLAVDTALGKGAVVDNAFASTRHLHIFEHFITRKEGRVPVQKVMSVVMAQGDELRGVVQVGRKGEARETVGPDFTADDLQALVRIAAVLGRHF